MSTAYRLLFGLVLLLFPLCVQAEAGDIHIKGSTTMAQMMRELVTSYRQTNPDQQFSLTSSDSGAGARALARGMAEIAMLSREMTSRELDKCAQLGITPRQFIIARDGVIPIVHPDNPITTLTLAQARGIYIGTITNWQELGGPDRTITVYSRKTTSGSHAIWNSGVLEGGAENSENVRIQSNPRMVATVAKDPTGIGYVGLGFATPQVKPLALKATMGDAATIRNGSYPIRRNLNLYTAGEPTGEIRRFIDFVLGDTGQAIIREAGFVPVW